MLIPLIFSTLGYRKVPITKAEIGDFKIKILSELKLILTDEKFISKSRLLLSSFTRVRRLSFQAIVLFIIQKSNSSLSACLFDFFDNHERIPPTKSAFSLARAPLCFKVFKRLNLMFCSLFYREANAKKWKGHRILAIDASTLRLPNHESLAKKFSKHSFGAKKSVERWMSRVSLLYDVMNGVVIDAQMESFKTSEADLCKKHLGFLRKGDLVVFDRYYASHYLFSVLTHKKVDFLFRMRDHSWNCVKEFLASNLSEQLVEVTSYQYSKVTKSIPANVTNKVCIRLIKQRSKGGKIKVFATSLLDTSTYKRTAICNLYKERWEVEEAFKTLKARLDVIHFSGKTVHAVQQDFYANVFLISMTSILKHDIKPILKRKSNTENKEKRVPKINNSYAIIQTKILIKKLLYSFEDLEKWLRQFIKHTKSAIEYSRKGQSNPRKTDKGHDRVFAMNYKTI